MDLKKIIREESEDLDWIRKIESDLIPGASYFIQSDNGVYWVPETFVGKEWDEEYNMEMYKFSEIGSDTSNHRMSINYVKSLIKSGKIRPYDPNWTILNEVNFSDDINDIEKGNFMIYFKGGTHIEQTIKIQEFLAKKGFSFYGKKVGDIISSRETNERIEMIDSINWDTSNKTYSNMDNDMRDKKKLLFSTKDNFTFKSEEKNNQRRFKVAIDHDAIVINGNKYLSP